MKEIAAILALALLSGAQAGNAAQTKEWQKDLLDVPYAAAEQPKDYTVQLLRQDYESLEFNRSILKTPMKVGDKAFEHGLGTHSVSRIRIYSPEPIAKFSSWVGVDHNDRTTGGIGSVVFSIAVNGKELRRSNVMIGGRDGEAFDVDVNGAVTIDLRVDDAGDGQGCDHADWADARIVTASGKTVRLDEMKLGEIPMRFARYPFSFTYAGKSSDELLGKWTREDKTVRVDADVTKRTIVWTDPSTGLRVIMDGVRYSDYPAVEWMLRFENTGTSDTALIENVQAMDLTVSKPLSAAAPYTLHSNVGGVPNPAQAMPVLSVIDEDHPATIAAGAGRGSSENLPFFRLDAGGETYVAAIGWSGCWKADFVCGEARALRMTAGLEKTRFVLHPGESVRSPRMLVLRSAGDAEESNSLFRELIYKRYCAKRDGKVPLPTIFCNTCFTRGGMWLNECNAENQISLINAYAPLGLEALLTDAGWFTGGWPNGAGNWDARKDAYPDGMAPVAAAALKKGMVYGLWYEPERVVAGTDVHREHPEWCLAASNGPQGTYLLNFGLPEVQRYFFNIVKGYMDLPGLRVYRQDFNMDPLPYWRFNDAPDRQGITEMKYIEGLYAYWDMIRKAWPDAFMEECASGGNRIDIETVMRMHAHQKTDYWFDDQTDQTAILGLSEYLPNNATVAHLNNLDTYSFHSTMASSLCLGWIADDKGFDSKRAKALIDRYKQVRHLMVGACYALLPCPDNYSGPSTPTADLWRMGPGDVLKYRKPYSEWVAVQYHRRDLNEGMVLAFRRPESPYNSVDVSLRGIDPKATYEVTWDSLGKKRKMKGSELVGSFRIELPTRRSSDLIEYRKVE